ncbi:hypothetical protein CRYUN_Cryun01aG0030700 [Craigia yunnanensis]
MNFSLRRLKIVAGLDRSHLYPRSPNYGKASVADYKISKVKSIKKTKFFVTVRRKAVSSVGGNGTDQQALLEFKANITSDQLGVMHLWNNSVHFCHWPGITCSH